MNSERGLNKWLLVVVALLFGVVGAATGDEWFKSVTLPAVYTETEQLVPAGVCTPKFTFNSGGRLYRRDVELSEVECGELGARLSNPQVYLSFDGETLTKARRLTEPAKVVEQRDFGRELPSRALRFMVAGMLGLLAGLLVISRQRLLRMLDFRFDRFLTPLITRIVYALSVAAIVLGGATLCILAIRGVETEPSSDSDFLIKVALVIATVVGIGLTWLLLRLAYEAVLVVFRLADDVRNLRNRRESP